jgi:transposase
VLARGSHPLDLPGIGPAGGARILADDVTGFPDRNHFASWTGTAPIDAFSGERAYFRRKRVEGKGGLEAMRCLKRRLSDLVCRQLVADSLALRTDHGWAGPGGHSGATLQSSAADLPPDIGVDWRRSDARLPHGPNCPPCLPGAT